jgi:tetratricopeptide (TPR) repeat protein
MLEDYEGTLEYFDQTNVLVPNDSYTLHVRGSVKEMLGDYKRALEDLDEANILEPNDSFILQW